MSKKYLISIIYFLPAVLIIAIIVCLSSSGNANFPEDKLLSISVFDSFTSAASDDGNTLTASFKDVDDGEYLILWSQDNFSYAAVDGEVIYEFINPRLNGRDTKLGAGLVFIPLLHDYSSKNIILCFNGEPAVEDIYKADYNEYVSFLFFSDKIRIVLSVTLLLASLLLFIIFISMGGFEKDNKDFSVTPIWDTLLFFALLAIWILSDARLLIFLSPVISAFISYMSFMLLSVPFVRLINGLLVKRSALLDAVIYAFIANTFVQCLLYLLGICDLPNMLILTHALYLILAVFVFYSLYKDVRNHKNSLIRVLFLSFGFILLMCVISIIGFWFVDGFSYIFLINLAIIIIVVALLVSTTQVIKKNISESVRMEELYLYAYTDFLTGLKNRNAYDNEIEAITSSGYRKNLSVVQMDVSGLKQTNDTLGHMAGDELLQGVSACLKKAFEGLEKIYRIGGDEFVVFSELSKDELNNRIDFLRSLGREYTGKMISKIEISIGIASWCDYADLSFVELLEIADKKMYEDKSEFYRKNGFDRRRR